MFSPRVVIRSYLTVKNSFTAPGHASQYPFMCNRKLQTQAVREHASSSLKDFLGFLREQLKSAAITASFSHCYHIITATVTVTVTVTVSVTVTVTEYLFVFRLQDGNSFRNLFFSTGFAWLLTGLMTKVRSLALDMVGANGGAPGLRYQCLCWVCAGKLGERGLGLVDHVPSGCVAKINIP